MPTPLHLRPSRCVYVCAGVCGCVCVREREEGKPKLVFPFGEEGAKGGDDRATPARMDLQRGGCLARPLKQHNPWLKRTAYASVLRAFMCLNLWLKQKADAF